MPVIYGDALLLVDYREGSKELVAPLRKRGLEVDEMTLEFGDIAFTGRGEGGRPTSVGIEFKQVTECVGSLRTERLQGHQLPGMVGEDGMYDIGYLLLEGPLLYNKSGQLMTWRRKKLVIAPGQMTIGEFYKRMNVLHLRGGLTPWHCLTRTDTLLWIEMLYRTWTDRDLDKHGSHLAIYHPTPVKPVSAFRRAVSAWPTIGYRTSVAVERAFGGSIQRAAKAPVSTWAAIQITDDEGKSRRLGDKDAERIVTFLEGR